MFKFDTIGSLRRQKAASSPVTRRSAGNSARKARRHPEAPIQRPETIPADLAGRWVAWSPDGLKILGHGATIAEARSSAGNLANLVISRVPSLDVLRPVCDSLETTAG
jgi:hypothetical protein